MRRDIIIQGGTVLISIILALSFFMLLYVGIMSPQNVIMSLILLVIAIIMLATVSLLSQIHDELKRMKK